MNADDITSYSIAYQSYRRIVELERVEMVDHFPAEKKNITFSVHIGS
jgi:hypothetical protein